MRISENQKRVQKERNYVCAVCVSASGQRIEMILRIEKKSPPHIFTIEKHVENIIG